MLIHFPLLYSATPFKPLLSMHATYSATVDAAVTSVLSLCLSVPQPNLSFTLARKMFPDYLMFEHLGPVSHLLLSSWFVARNKTTSEYDCPSSKGAFGK